MFDLSTSKWGHGSTLSWASFLPIFSLLCPSFLGLGSGTGQTDRQTTASMHYASALWGRGIIKTNWWVSDIDEIDCTQHSTLPSVDRFTYSAEKYNILVSRVINCFMLCALIPGQYWHHHVPFNSPKLFTVDCGVVNLRWLRFAVSVASFAGRYQVYTERQRNRMDSGHLSSSATFTGDTC